MLNVRYPGASDRLCSVNVKHSSRGFTVIELVAVLVLIGVLAVTTYSRWFSSGSFESSATVADITSAARLAQRIAISKPANTITLEVNNVAGTWEMAVMEDDGGAVSTLFQIDNDSGNAITVTGVTGPVTLSAANDLVINYDALGNLDDIVVGGSSLGASVGAAISVSSGSSKTMCISPVGFAHAGTCV